MTHPLAGLDAVEYRAIKPERLVWYTGAIAGRRRLLLPAKVVGVVDHRGQDFPVVDVFGDVFRTQERFVSVERFGDEHESSRLG